MATIVPSSIVGDIRGSVSTETYARNQGGLYVRERKGPLDNTGANRVAIRNTMTALSRTWSADLTEGQRSAWRKYARQHPRPDRWGRPHLVNGYTRYIQHNFRRYHLDSAVAFSDPPPSPHLHQPAFTFTANGAADTVTIMLPPVNFDPPWTNLELFAYGGYDISPGVNFYASPWRYVGRNEYNGAWSTDPWTIAYPFDLVAADKVFVKLIAQKSDTGELSEAYQTSAIIG